MSQKPDEWTPGPKVALVSSICDLMGSNIPEVFVKLWPQFSRAMFDSDLFVGFYPTLTSAIWRRYSKLCI